MAAVRSMAIIADAWLWPMLRAIEPGSEVHILDVCPVLWPRCCTWLEEAAASPQTVIDGSLCLRMSLEAGKQRTTPRKQQTASAKRRAARAKLDLQRIRAAIDADARRPCAVVYALPAIDVGIVLWCVCAASYMNGHRACDHTGAHRHTHS